MEPLTIGILAGGIFAGLTGASLAALKDGRAGSS